MTSHPFTARAGSGRRPAPGTRRRRRTAAGGLVTSAALLASLGMLAAAAPAEAAKDSRGTVKIVVAHDVVGHSTKVGRPVQVTATITGGRTEKPTGTVTFLNVGISDCVEVPVVDGVASCTAVYRYPTTSSVIRIRARYSGDSTYRRGQAQVGDDGWFRVGFGASTPTIHQIAMGKTTAARPAVVSPGLQGESGTLIAFVTAAGPEEGGQAVTSVTSPAGPWHRVTGVSGTRGVSEIWATDTPWHYAAGRVTATLDKPGYPASITVIKMSDAPVPTLGAAAAGDSGPASVALTPVEDRTLVLAAGWADGATALPTPAPGQQIVTGYVDPNAHGAGWLQLVATAPTPGQAVTASATVPGPWQLSAVDITTWS
ncbi:MAG: Ig-like domain-containing protein [Kineosporiaceae bacterium]